ncbi:MAG: hypothetical protein QM504_14705 [Pseudomonadota bacterium]
MNENLINGKTTLPVELDNVLWLKEMEAHIQFLDELQSKESKELLKFIENINLSENRLEKSITLPLTENILDVVKTFNILPSTTTEQYLSRANIHSSISESLSEDWKKVSNDLWFSLVNVIKTEKNQLR